MISSMGGDTINAKFFLNFFLSGGEKKFPYWIFVFSFGVVLLGMMVACLMPLAKREIPQCMSPRPVSTALTSYHAFRGFGCGN